MFGRAGARRDGGAAAAFVPPRGPGALGLSHDTAWRWRWRWRMAIISTLLPEPGAALAGIVEADEAHQPQRRAGMGSAPARSRKPRCATASALAGLQASWRVGDSAAGRLASQGKEAPHGDGPHWPAPVMARGAVLCSDGHPTCERIAKDERIPHSTRDGDRNAPRAAITSTP